MEDFLEFDGPVTVFSHASSRGKDDAPNLRVTCPVEGNEKRQAANLKFNNSAIRLGLADAKICLMVNKGKLYVIRSEKDKLEKLKELIPADRLKQINIKGTVGSFTLVELIQKYAKFTPEERFVGTPPKAEGFHLHYNVHEGRPCPYGIAFELTPAEAFESDDDDEPETGEVTGLAQEPVADALPEVTKEEDGASTF